MSYYMGDFYGSPSMYRGPGRGDPGFFSFLGGLAKKAVGLIPGIGPAASAVMEHIPAAGARGAAQAAMKRVGGAIIKHPVLSGAAAAGAVAGAGVEVGRMMAAPGARGACTFVTKHGVSKPGHISKHSGRCVRNRHMNVCNPRALRRAIRRTHGFAKLAMKTIHITHPKKKGRFGGFKRRRKR